MTPSLEKQLKALVPSLDYCISDDFIGVFDGVFPQEFCQEWINHFKQVDAAGATASRVQTHNEPAHFKKDQSTGYMCGGIYTQSELNVQCRHFDFGFWKVCYPLYVEKYSLLGAADPHKIYSLRIQKTIRGGGYHAWHFESSERTTCNRLLVFMLYFNDVHEGGETEFLYLGKRIQPKMGRLLLWPASFTHTHRGNPPLKEDKYIMTGWVEY